jgi:hypothetical protein
VEVHVYVEPKSVVMVEKLLLLPKSGEFRLTRFDDSSIRREGNPTVSLLG